MVQKTGDPEKMGSKREKKKEASKPLYLMRYE